MNQSSKQWLEAISLVARWPDTPRRMGNSREVWVGVSGLRSFRLRVVSPTSYSPTCEVVSRTCWVSSLTAFAWSVAERRRYVQAYRTFLYHGWENEAYTCGALVSLLSGTTGLAPTWGGGGGTETIPGIGLLFTHKNCDFGAISVKERSCGAPLSIEERHISNRFCATLWYNVNRYSDRGGSG